MTVSFDTTPAEQAVIRKIAARAVKLGRQHGGAVDRLSTSMDVTACHANGCPLDLQKLLAFDDFNFMHDVFGLARHLDRETGQPANFFRPRCALPQTELAAA